jgi:hypothetical protein
MREIEAVTYEARAGRFLGSLSSGNRRVTSQLEVSNRTLPWSSDTCTRIHVPTRYKTCASTSQYHSLNYRALYRPGNFLPEFPGTAPMKSPRFCSKDIFSTRGCSLWSGERKGTIRWLLCSYLCFRPIVFWVMKFVMPSSSIPATLPKIRTAAGNGPRT